MKSCFHDAMHTIYLGIGRDIVSNILADMVDCGVLGPGSLDEQLRRLSLAFQTGGVPWSQDLMFCQLDVNFLQKFFPLFLNMGWGTYVGCEYIGVPTE